MSCLPHLYKIQSTFLVVGVLVALTNKCQLGLIWVSGTEKNL